MRRPAVRTVGDGDQGRRPIGPPSRRRPGSLRARLLVASWIPVLVVACGAGWIIKDRVSAYEQVRAAEHMVSIAPGLVAFDVALERESRAAVGLPGPTAERAHEATDIALDTLLDEMRPLTGTLPENVAQHADELIARSGPERLDLRERAARGDAGAVELATAYARMRHEVATLPALLARGLTDRALAHELDALSAVNVLAVDASTWDLLARAGTASGEPDLLADAAFRTAAERSARAAEQAVQDVSDPPAIPALVPARDGGPAGYGAYAASLREAQDHLAERSAEAARAATRASLVTGAAAGLVALVTVTGLAVAAPVLARSVIRPLEELAARTEESVAALPTRLRWIEEGRTVVRVDPQRSPATGDDEISRVSRRIDELVSTTVDMATAQARHRASLKEALSTVAQRESSLVRRQLVLLDEFERFEEDPEALSRLFRLDHLATQLRRSCDSLLVIAGARTTRRTAPPMSLVDVLRSAASQVEQYARVDIVAACDPFVRGPMTGDLIHLFAEVLDNATTYSQPSTRVEVRVATDGACVIVRVRDHGIGFDGAALEKARARIARPDDALIDLGRLGLLVVGRLGERTGARTTIERPGVGEGTVVTTLLPPEVLDHADAGTPSSRDVAGPWHQFDESAARPGVVTLYGQRTVVPLGGDQDQDRTAVRRTDPTDGSTP